MGGYKIPQIPPQAAVAINGVLDAILRRLDALEKKASAPAVCTRDFTAREGQCIRVQAPPTGLSIVLPAPKPSNRGAEITILAETTGPIRFSAVRGTVNRERVVFSTVLGTIKCVSNGHDNWTCGFGISSTGSPTGATGATGPSGRDGADGEMGVPGPPGPVDPIPDQRVLGNDSGQLKKPYAITVHQELDWIASGWNFDGVDDRVTHGNVLARERNQTLTLGIWVTTTSGGELISKYDATQPFPPGIRMFMSTTNFSFYEADSVITADMHVQSSGTLAVANGARHFLMATYSGSTTGTGVNLYFDGALVSKTVLGASVSNSILNTAPWLIGGFTSTGVGGQFFAGKLEHAQIYHAELTAAQVAECYGGGTPPDLNSLATAPKPVLWAKLDGSDTTGAGGIHDYGTGGNNGTAENGLTRGAQQGTLAVRGPTVWDPLVPGPTGWVLTSTGVFTKPAYRAPQPTVIVTQGEEVPGPQGDPGPPGPRGATGPTGDRGPPGVDGADGVDGNDGPPGATGPTGAMGLQGPPGNDGVDGQDGQDGPQGLQGLIGATGPQGIPGGDGVEGAEGPLGPPGPGSQIVLSPGQVLGNQIDAAGIAYAHAITPTEVGTLIRLAETNTVTAPGTYHNHAVTGAVLRVFPNAAGDVEFTGFALTGGNAGGFLRLLKANTTGITRVILKYNNAGSTAANRIVMPTGVDFVLNEYEDMVDLQYFSADSRWHVVTNIIPTAGLADGAVTNAKRANMAAGTVSGRAIDAGTGAPQDLDGAQLGSLHRRYWYIADTTSSGTINGYALAEKEIQIHFGQASPVTIRSFTVGTSGKVLEIVLESTAASVTLQNEHASGTLGLIRTPGAVDLVLNGGDGCTLTFINNRYRVTGVARIVPNAGLANMAVGTVKGRAINAGSTGTPTDLTGAQVGELTRYAFGETLTLTPGGGSGAGGDFTSSDIVLDARTTTLFLRTSSDAEVRIRSMAHGSSSAGVNLHVVKELTTGRITFVDNNDGFGSVWTPQSVDFTLTRYNDSCDLKVDGSAFRWRVNTRTIGPATLAPVVSNFAVPFAIYVAFAAGAAGTADDVTIYNANAPFAFRIIDVTLLVSTLIGASTLQLRDTTGGGGAALSSLLSGAVAGTARNNDTVTRTVASAGSVYLRRSDRGVAGEIIITAVRT